MDKSTFPFSVESWTIEYENKEYQTPIFNLLKQKLRLDSEDHEGTFYVLDIPAWVNVIALTPEKEVILVEQYRFGITRPSLEIPGGVCDEGESPLETAKRELLEETGYRSDNWTELGKVSANPAIQNNYNYCYLAEECTRVESQSLDQHERIIVHKMPYDEFLECVRDGTIDHAIVTAAVAKLLLRETSDGRGEK